MGITLLTTLLFSTNPNELNTVQDASLYVEYAKELNALHKLELQPDDEIVDHLLSKIDNIQAKTIKAEKA